MCARLFPSSADMNTKYVFLDVDGTLVNFESKMPSSTVEALKKAQENGHKMIIATGRQKSQIYPWLLEQVRFDGILGCCGAYLEYNGEEIYRFTCPHDRLCEIIDFFHSHGMYYCLQSRDAVYAEQKDLEYIRNFMIERGNAPEVIESVLGTAIVTDDPKSLTNIEKLAYYSSPFGIEQIREMVGNYYEVVSYSLGKDPSGKFENFHGEMNFDGITKATGIAKFMEIVGAPLSDTIAVGDSGNDYEMIKFASIGVCMGNGADAVKEIADVVTTDIDDDGIYNAFVQLGLI